MKFLLVFLGGGAGSVLRYAVALMMNGRGWPWGTLAVNVLGSFLIGLVGALSGKGVISEEARLFLAVGLCGGFTTFSTFSGECLAMLRAGDWLIVAVYIAVSVLAGIAAVWISVNDVL